MSTAILIPARAASTRFPNKPLALLNGVPMIRRVYDRCAVTGLDTFVLTDSKKIASLFPEGNVIIDDTDYDNGTERCCGALDKLPNEYDYIIIDYMESDQRKEKIKVETSDKITFGNDSLFHITFYKRTNKILERYSTGGNYVFKCDQLN